MFVVPIGFLSLLFFPANRNEMVKLMIMLIPTS